MQDGCEGKQPAEAAGSAGTRGETEPRRWLPTTAPGEMQQRPGALPDRPKQQFQFHEQTQEKQWGGETQVSWETGDRLVRGDPRGRERGLSVGGSRPPPRGRGQTL